MANETELHCANGDQPCSGKSWGNLTDPILLQIFAYLTPYEIISSSATCKHWEQVCSDEMLWKMKFCQEYSLSSSTTLKPGKTWRAEFKRLSEHIPLVQTDIIKLRHAVHHVSFSHNGKLFATCSANQNVMVWNLSYPATLKYEQKMAEFRWTYTQHSEFNKSDTLLLVSGIHFGNETGDIAVFSLQDEKMLLLCRILNKPQEIFGTFYSEEYILSGDMQYVSMDKTVSHILINKTYQEVTCELKPNRSRLFCIENSHVSSISMLTVANYEGSPYTEAEPEHEEFNNTSYDEDESYEDVPIFNLPDIRHAECAEFPEWNQLCCGNEFTRQMIYGTLDSDEAGSKSNSYIDDIDIDYEEDLSKEPNKLLIFARTSQRNIVRHHQIGVKHIGPVKFPKMLDPGPSVAERLAARREMNPRHGTNVVGKTNNYDTIDHIIDLNSMIIGMKLSPDHRYLYVNTRSWPSGVDFRTSYTPLLSTQIQIHVIDLVTFTKKEETFRGHKAYTIDTECNLIFLDVSKDYVASGADNKHGYIWDRHYGFCVAMYPHVHAVKSVAFNPRNQEILVTVSDDGDIKIWRSRAIARKLFGSNLTGMREAVIKLQSENNSHRFFQH